MLKTLAIFDSKKTIKELILFDNQEAIDEFLEGKNLQYLILESDANIGIGYKYSTEHKEWLPPKPYDNWILDAKSLTWIPPIPKPEPAPEGDWFWHQEDNAWVNIVTPEN